MKYLMVLTLAAVAPLYEEPRINGENGWFVPRLDSTFDWISLTDAKSMFVYMADDRTLTVVEFYLYTKANQVIPQKISPSDAVIKSSDFNNAYPTRFIIHGWTDNYLSPSSTSVRDALISSGGDFNLIVVDWSSRSQSPNYASSVYYVPAVGIIVAEFIDYLSFFQGMSMQTLTLIGFSLGAHVAGFAGKNTKQQINTIIGLDPALPLYSYDSPGSRLTSTDAFYVQSIQTNGGVLGFLKPIGSAAFYPNGGQIQPGCDVFDNDCSHDRSFLYYAESLRLNDFPSIQCYSYEDAVQRSCGITYSAVRMGGVLSNKFMATGDFYVPVNAKFPFGMAGYS